MYGKAKTFKDDITADKILNLNRSSLAQKFISGEISGGEIAADKDAANEWNGLMSSIKKLGRGISNYDGKIWEEKRVSVMTAGIRRKFLQNPHLKQALLDTGDLLMAEASPTDRVWGIGLSAYDAKTIDPSKWPGQNLLGKCLTLVKADIQNITNKQDTIANNPKAQIEVVNFYHINKTIPEDGEYIGRLNQNYNLPWSLFANPFPVYNPDERDASIAKYKTWLWQKIADKKITKSHLLSLNGKKLVCYCKPKSCHGDILKETVELLINNESKFDAKIMDIQNNKKPLKP